MLGHKTSLNKFKRFKKKNGEYTNTWRLNNMLLKNQWLNEEIREEIRKFLETNENKNTTFQNIWETAKAILRGTFTMIQAYLKKPEKSQINNLIYRLGKLEKEEQTKPEVSRRKETTKIRVRRE